VRSRSPPKPLVSLIATALTIAIAAGGCASTHGAERLRETTTLTPSSTTTSLPITSEPTVVAGTLCMAGVAQREQLECLVQPGVPPNPPCYTVTENCNGLPSDIPIVNGYPSPAMDGYFDLETTTSTSPTVYLSPSTTTTQCFKTPAQSEGLPGAMGITANGQPC